MTTARDQAIDAFIFSNGVAVGREEMRAEAITVVGNHDKANRGWVNGSLWDTLTRETEARIRAIPATGPKPVIIDLLTVLTPLAESYLTDLETALEDGTYTDGAEKLGDGLRAIEHAKALTGDKPPRPLRRPGMVLIPDDDNGQPTTYHGIPSGSHKVVDLLRAYSDNREAIQFIADMLE